jgi:Tol biopolymer transport system component
VREPDNTLWLIGADGSDPRRLEIAACRQVCDYPAFAPHGDELAFSVIEPEDGRDGPIAGRIEVLDLATLKTRRLARTTFPDVLDRPRWSPDGRSLVIGIDRFDHRYSETGSSIAILPIAGGDPDRLTDPDDYAYQPDWSPDGDLVYSVETLAYRLDADPLAGAWDLHLVSRTAASPDRDPRGRWGPPLAAVLDTRRLADHRDPRRPGLADGRLRGPHNGRHHRDRARPADDHARLRPTP